MLETTVKYRKDYQAPDYAITATRLTVEITDAKTVVISDLDMQRLTCANDTAPLVLDGEQQTLLSIKLNDNLLPPHEYQLTEHHLTLNNLPNSFTLSISSEIHPETNTSLEGLFKSQDMYCTQCEAHGFRRITYYLDRPDVLSTFTCKIIADRSLYPVLLSNGNKIGAGQLDQNRHYAVWHDPFRKPCYLFALVAGDLAVLKDEYVTASGRPVALEIYTAHQDIAKCQYAMKALKQAMRWDEERFGREYDLDIYMIVAASDFNMGAMENKGLNIFNTKYVLADSATSTDLDFQNVQAVIGHEYFHNWTGNRVTCRDWFQLSLKEGLTVFRDQEFTSDHHSRAVKRIEDVKIIRGQQFAEDASPMSHPIRPESYIEMNNFYTVTVYNKGAEVIRMQYTLLGAEGFCRGMDLYFQRHDGQAVTCDDFVTAMADANHVDLTQFRLWYAQAGTPELIVKDHYDPITKTYTLTIQQRCAPSAGQLIKLPFHIPIKVGLISLTGAALNVKYQDKLTETHLLELREPEQQFVFEEVTQAPIPSLLRDFSAPVKLDYAYSEAQLQILSACDSNPFNRWDAGQTLAARLILQLTDAIQAGRPLRLPAAFIDVIKATLLAADLDKALIAKAITLPNERILGEIVSTIDPLSLHQAREFVLNELAINLKDLFSEIYQQNHETAPYAIDRTASAKRRLKNACLSYLMQGSESSAITLCQTQFAHANNMTDQLAALQLLANCRDSKACDTALASFYQQWQNEALVLDKWLMVQSTSKRSDTLARVETLLTHPAFDYKNPNKVYALLMSFSQNIPHFHAVDGSGYQLMETAIAKLDALNPQVAARLVRSLMNWRRYHQPQQQAMKRSLAALAQRPKLSKDVYEIVSKSLSDQ